MSKPMSHYLAIFDKQNMDDVLLMYHLLYTNASEDLFGGEDALDKRQELDRQKKAFCNENAVRLIEWPYDIEPTDANVKALLS